MLHRFASVLRRSAAALAVGVTTTGRASAQADPARVALRVTVPPQATVEQQSELWARSVSGGGAEYVVVVRSNTSYRLIARRVGVGGPALTLGILSAGGAVTASLPADRRAVEMLRGHAGVTAFEVTFSPVSDAAVSAADAIRFDAVPEDPARRLPAPSPRAAVRAGRDAETPPQRDPKS